MKEPVFLEPLFPDRSSGENLAVQLARRLRDAIERRELAPGTRLLGTRQLASRLGLGRNTVALAFEELTAQGYLEARAGAGTFVASIGLKQRARRSRQTWPQPARARRAASLRSYFGVARGSGPLRPGVPDLAAFPHATWMRCARKALGILRQEVDYGASAGLRILQEAIATHVRQFRGVTTQPEHVIVLEGAQAAMHLAAFVLAEPGDRIAIEDPCYALARAAFEAYGLRVAAVRVDARGLDVERLPHDAKLAFVTPTHQFPLGGLLPVARRIALLAWAKRSNAYILEDDYDSEFTSKTRPLPALQSLDRDERVLYIGSFSKTLAPAVRLGYLIVPPHLAARLPRRAREHEPRGLAASASHGRLLHHPRPLRASYSANERALRAAARHPYRDVARTSSSCFLYWPNLDRPSRRRHRRPWICGHAVDLRKRSRSLRRPLGAVHRAARLFGYPAGLRQRRRFGDRASRHTRRRAP